jgi:hypothetical protein
MVRFHPLAQVTGGLGIIDDSVQQLEAVQQAWDTRWQDIFASSSGLYLGINQFAAIILVGAFLFFATGWVKEAIERGIFPSLPNVLWVLTIAVLLFNNGALLGSATLGIRNLINSQTQTVLQVQVGEISMMEALNDVIVSQQAKALIQQEYAECDSAGRDRPRWTVSSRQGERAQQVLEQEYRARGFWSAGLERLWNRVQQVTQAVEQTYSSERRSCRWQSSERHSGGDGYADRQSGPGGAVPQGLAVGLRQPAGDGHAADGADRSHCCSGVGDSIAGATAVVLAGGVLQPGDGQVFLQRHRRSGGNGGGRRRRSNLRGLSDSYFSSAC